MMSSSTTIENTNISNEAILDELEQQHHEQQHSIIKSTTTNISPVTSPPISRSSSPSIIQLHDQEDEDPHSRLFCKLLQADDEPIDIYKLKRASRTCIPDYARPIVWNLLLGVTSPHNLHDPISRSNRQSHYLSCTSSNSNNSSPNLQHYDISALPRRIRRVLNKLKPRIRSHYISSYTHSSANSSSSNLSTTTTNSSHLVTSAALIHNNNDSPSPSNSPPPPNVPPPPSSTASSSSSSSSSSNSTSSSCSTLSTPGTTVQPTETQFPSVNNSNNNNNNSNSSNNNSSNSNNNNNVHIYHNRYRHNRHSGTSRHLHHYNHLRRTSSSKALNKSSSNSNNNFQTLNSSSNMSTASSTVTTPTSPSSSTTSKMRNGAEQTLISANIIETYTRIITAVFHESSIPIEYNDDLIYLITPMLFIYKWNEAEVFSFLTSFLFDTNISITCNSINNSNNNNSNNNNDNNNKHPLILYFNSTLENSSLIHENVSKFLSMFRNLHSDLYDLFINEDIDLTKWATSWLRGLLVNQLQPSCLLRLWDVYFSADLLYLHPFVCLVFVTNIKSKLLECDDTERILTTLSSLPNVDIDRVVAHAITARDEHLRDKTDEFID